MTFKAKTIDDWCAQKFPELTETGETIENAKKNEQRETGEDPFESIWKIPPRLEPKCLVSRERQRPIPCYFHGWFQLNTPTKDGSSISYPVGIVEHRDDGICEQVKVTSIKFVEEFE